MEINNSSLVLFRLPLPHCKNGKWNDKNEKYLKSNDVYLTESKKMQSSFNEDQKVNLSLLIKLKTLCYFDKSNSIACFQ